jgi:RNA polymerase sigma-70 factor (ECF subfamily)
MARADDHLRALMLAGLDGDADAQRELLKALAELFRRFFRKRLADDAMVEDLVQESLIALHTRRASYDRDRPFLPWAYALARYKMIDRMRQSRSFVAIEEAEWLADEADFAAASGARLDLNRMLGTLSEKQASVIRATKLDGLSVAEAAAREQISESDVKISVHRGLRALAKRFGVEQ